MFEKNKQIAHCLQKQFEKEVFAQFVSYLQGNKETVPLTWLMLYQVIFRGSMTS